MVARQLVVLAGIRSRIEGRLFPIVNLPGAVERPDL
jgi:hypothetical protein